jgi:peptide-methionine (S)-S-oxide reductase
MPQQEVVTLGGGCFWCVEAVFNQMEGVVSAISGYMGGARPNPTYQQVCTGVTGHIEVVQVTFDPAVTSFREILEVFFAVHDPTSRDRQGNDVGEQYRSIVFYHSDEQRRETEKMIAELGDDIVTELRAAETFWPAEDYHQEYFSNNPNAGYCAFVVAPKVAKFRSKFAAKLRHA